MAPSKLKCQNVTDVPIAPPFFLLTPFFFYKYFGKDMHLREIIMGPRCKTGKGKI